ncbi:MAG: hypothetical protein V3R67_08825 [Thermodesulfobacteriota bacterium]
MNSFSGSIVCTLMALVNLPYVLQDGGSTINLAAMVFCGTLAFVLLVSALRE